MNFHISKSLNEEKVNLDDYNDDCDVWVSDNLSNYIYSLKDKIPFKDNVLYEIAPYDDTIITLKDIQQIIDIATYLLNSSLLKNFDYDEDDDGNPEEAMRNLVELSLSAIRQEKNLISIGDWLLGLIITKIATANYIKLNLLCEN